LKPHFPHDLLCIKHGALTRSDFRRWFGAGGPKKTTVRFLLILT
jgi:hypothetical protein